MRSAAHALGWGVRSRDESMRRRHSLGEVSSSRGVVVEVGHDGAVGGLQEGLEVKLGRVALHVLDVIFARVSGRDRQRPDVGEWPQRFDAVV